MSRAHLFAVVVVALMVVSGAGCPGHSPSEPTPQDSISIASIVPAAGTKLAPGSAVTFTVTVNYQSHGGGLLFGDQSTIHMAIFDAHGDLTPGVSKTVGPGPGSVTLSDRITVPAMGVSEITVEVILTPPTINIEFLFATVSYPVGP